LNVWVPAGRYTVTGHIVLNHVTIRGAGPWYTTLHGAGVGLYGDYAAEPDYPSNDDGNAGPSAHVGIYDLAIQGETTNRVDAAQVNGIGGSLGSGSIVQNVWIEHTKVGMWLDGPFSGLHIVGCRIHDVTADGINFHDGISYATVEETDIRNTGDDGLAMWSERHADYNDTFAFNSVRNPILANNFAIYGGHDNSVVGDYGADTLTQGGGIHVGNRFSSVLLSGTTTVSGNTLDRTGEQDPNWNYGVGAIWFYALDAPMKGTINVSNNTLNDSTDEAYQFTSDGNYAITNVTVTGDTVNKVGTFVVQIQTSGSATFRDVVAHDIGIAGVDDCYNTTGTHAFVLTADTGDDTWANSRGCYALGGLGTDVGTATPVAQPTWTPAPVPPAPQTVWLQNKGNGQYVTYDPTTNVARFTPTLDPNDLNEQWLVVSFNGKLHICSVTNKEPYGPGQDTACWSEQAWTDSVQPTPPGAPAPGSDRHLPYIRVGSTYDSWGSNQFSLIDQGDGYDQIKVTGWYNDLVDSSAGYGYADVTYTPSSPANAEWKVIPVGGTATPTSAPGP
jgi:hypothetical protein